MAEQLQGAHVSVGSAEAIARVTLPCGSLAVFRAAVAQEVSEAHADVVAVVNAKSRRRRFGCSLCPNRHFSNAAQLERNGL